MTLKNVLHHLRNDLMMTLCWYSLEQVAARTAELINWLNDEAGLSLSNIHIWGHSLGGQCSGMTGYYVQSYGKGSVARVTGKYASLSKI